MPFFEKVIEILFHKAMTLFRNFFCGMGIHPVFQQQQFFVKMIGGGQRDAGPIF